MAHFLTQTLNDHFASLKDPRRDTLNKRHYFSDILAIAICGALAGADDWTSIADFGQAKESWFKTFLKLPNGIPSHDTFNNVFEKLDTKQFQGCFTEWVASLVDSVASDIVPVDGKTLRRSHDESSGKQAIHMVSAWSSENSLVLGQVKTEEKSNEITAIPVLLQMLALDGALVSIDAMGCQKKIAETILDKNADYLLAVKNNQPTLYQAIWDAFFDTDDDTFYRYFDDYEEVSNKNRDRIENRYCWVCHDPNDILTSEHEWDGLNCIIVIESERTLKGKTTIAYRFYIASRCADANYYLSAIRTHWQIENQLNWVLDVAFREDDSRVRKGNGAENFSILRHIALNLLKQETTAKLGVKNKRLRAGWDEKYLKKLLWGLKSYQTGLS